MGKIEIKDLEEEYTKALCKVYCEYLQEKLNEVTNQSMDMIAELKQHAKTDKQIEKLNYMISMEASFHKWIKCKIIHSTYNCALFALDKDLDQLLEC